MRRILNWIHHRVAEDTEKKSSSLKNREMPILQRKLSRSSESVLCARCFYADNQKIVPDWSPFLWSVSPDQRKADSLFATSVARAKRVVHECCSNAPFSQFPIYPFFDSPIHPIREENNVTLWSKSLMKGKGSMHQRVSWYCRCARNSRRVSIISLTNWSIFSSASSNLKGAISIKINWTWIVCLFDYSSSLSLPLFLHPPAPLLFWEYH